MNKEEITLEEAENYIDNIYQHKFDDMEEIKEDGTQVVYINGLDNLEFNDFEIASFRLLREEQILKYKNEQLKERIDKATNLYLKTLAEQKQVDDLACKMFNLLEGNKQ